MPLGGGWRGVSLLERNICHRYPSSAQSFSATHFFYKQPHFPIEPRVAIRSAQNEAQNFYDVAYVFWRLQADINKNRAK